ncbi:hypothetical protein Egran_03270, partial [Elaphomyces granulatus]
MWDLCRCFPAIKEIAMNATRINDLSNAITMAAYLHKEFGEFSLAYIEMPNVYNLKTYRDFLGLLPADRRVELRAAPDMEEAPLPHPIFLSTDFAIAEILHVRNGRDDRPT